MWTVFAKQKYPSAQRIALVVAGVFAATGAAWVLLTDVLLYEVTRDSVLVARIETAKGWMFVLLATLLLYVVAYRSALRLARAQSGVSAVVESIADGVLLLGPDRAIRRANPAAMQMLGAEDLVGMNAEEFSRRFRVSYLSGALVPPQDFVSQRVFDEGGPLHYKARLYPENAPERIVSVTAAAVRVYAAESPEMVVSVMHDITESERLSALRDQFFDAAAHGLKTPVAIIKANVHLLLTGGASYAAEAAADIGQQCDRMDLLVQNLFVVGRIRSDSLRLYPHETELAALVEQVTTAERARCADRRIASELPPGWCPRIHADQERFALALRNLLDEAIRLSVPPEPVTMMLVRQERDAAIGVRHRAPTPGQKGPSQLEQDDLGIGRLVATAIIEAHGGTLRDCTQGSEATTWITLPVIESGA